MTSSVRKVTWSNDHVTLNMQSIKKLSLIEVTQLHHIYYDDVYVRANFGTIIKHLLGGFFVIGNRKWASKIDLDNPQVSDLWKTWCEDYIEKMICFGLVIVAITPQNIPMVLDPSLYNITITVNDFGIIEYLVGMRDRVIENPFKYIMIFEVVKPIVNPTINRCLNPQISSLRQIIALKNTAIQSFCMGTIKLANPLAFTSTGLASGEADALTDLHMLHDNQQNYIAQNAARNKNAIQVSEKHTRLMIAANAKQDEVINGHPNSKTDPENKQELYGLEIAQQSFSTLIHALPNGHSIVAGPNIQVPNNLDKIDLMHKQMVSDLAGVPQSFMGDTNKSSLAADLTSLMTFRQTILHIANKFTPALEQTLYRTLQDQLTGDKDALLTESMKITFPSIVPLDTLKQLLEMGAINADVFKKYAPSATGLQASDIDTKRMEEKMAADVIPVVVDANKPEALKTAEKKNSGVIETGEKRKRATKKESRSRKRVKKNTS